MGAPCEVPASFCPWREWPQPALGGEDRPPCVGLQGGVPAAHSAVLGRRCSLRAGVGSGATSPRPLCLQGPPGQPGAKVSARRVSGAPPLPPSPLGVVGECVEHTEAGGPRHPPCLRPCSWGRPAVFLKLHTVVPLASQPCLLTGKEGELQEGTPQPLGRHMVPRDPRSSSRGASSFLPTCSRPHLPLEDMDPSPGVASPSRSAPDPGTPRRSAPADMAVALRMFCFDLQNGDISLIINSLKL